MNKNEYTRLAQQNEIDDLDDIVEEQCQSTPTGAMPDTSGRRFDESKGAKSQQKAVRNARKLKAKFRKHAESRVDQWP
jgi:hypothetical protein